MKEQEIKTTISSILESERFQVQQIPEGDEKTPDLLATKTQTYLIEIKTKEDEPRLMQEWNHRLSEGELVSSAMPFTNQAAMCRIVRNGIRQLSAYRTSDHDFCILWLLTTGYDPQGQSEQFLSTLFGTTNVRGSDYGGLIPCYYFDHSEFFRAQGKLDGAVVTTVSGDQGHSRLCVNTYSPQVEKFRCSSLAKMFSSAIVDPLELENRGDAYVADCEEDRNDEQSVLRYLAKKYNRPALMRMDLGSLHARIESKRVEIDGDDST